MMTIKNGYACLLLWGLSAFVSAVKGEPLDYTLPMSEYQPRLSASNPAGWKPAVCGVTVPTEGIQPAGGLFKPALERNTKYLLNSFTVKHLLIPFYERAGKTVEPDEKPQVKFWDTDLRGSNAGRFLMGAGNTLRWLPNEELRNRLNEVIDGIELCRETNGYILPYPPQPGKIRSEEPNYARAWLTHGLIDAAIAGNPKSYGLLRGHTDWFNSWDEMLPQLLHWSMNSHQGHIAATRTYLSPIGKPEDLQTAEKYYVCDWWLDELTAKNPDAVWKYPLQNPHSYLITSFEAYLDHYLATGDKRYLTAMQNAWDLIHEHWEHIGGSTAICESQWTTDDKGQRIVKPKDFPHAPDSYSLTKGHTGETCGSVFWIKFNQRFHRLFPAEEKYVTEIEKSVYNIILANQTDSGNIRYHSRMEGKKETPGISNTCCEGQGTRMLGSLPEYIYSLADDGIYVNLFEPSSIQWQVKDKPVTLTMESGFPFKPDVTLNITAGSPVTMKMRIRIPSWAAKPVEVTVNGQSAGTGKPASYLELVRNWQSGDKVEFVLPAAIKVTPYTGADSVDGFNRYAVEYGPVLLACIGEEDAPHKLSVTDLEKSLVPDPAKPLHFTLQGDPAHSFMPYWMIDGQKFTVCPLIRK
ncbi:MAG: glycoside hydrolase family 127 protein [Planctomycetaceae bacterium]|jgi:DUF1680 family protein|nr:glycoside hydrolase family 127 protein [Planctomycetaceae bacterium]